MIVGPCVSATALIAEPPVGIRQPGHRPRRL